MRRERSTPGRSSPAHRRLLRPACTLQFLPLRVLTETSPLMLAEIHFRGVTERRGSFRAFWLPPKLFQGIQRDRVQRNRTWMTVLFEEINLSPLNVNLVPAKAVLLAHPLVIILPLQRLRSVLAEPLGDIGIQICRIHKSLRVNARDGGGDR